MTDKQILRLAQKAHKLVNKAHEAIKLADSAYEKRFGTTPSDIDNDGWIDAVHYGQGYYHEAQEIIDDHNLYSK